MGPAERSAEGAPGQDPPSCRTRPLALEKLGAYDGTTVMAVVTPDVVRQVAVLARLRLEGEALTQLAAQLDEILQYVQQLQSVNTDRIEPTSHVLPLSNVLRKDEPKPCLGPDVVAALAPASQKPFVKVPKVIET